MSTTRVYQYGARPQSIGPLLRAQMRLGHTYYNRLVEAENARRKVLWGGDHAPAPPHEECRCVECGAHWKAVADAVYAKPQLDLKPLRSRIVSEGLTCWGTYLVVEQAFAAALKTTKPWHSLRFRSWRQGMSAAIQLQPGTRERAHLWWRLTPAADPRTGKRAQDGRGRHTVEIRIGSEGRQPVFSEPIQIAYHRPHAGEVTWVSVQLRQDGPRERATVSITCAEAPAKPRGAGLVAVDVGWRVDEGDTIRVGWARDTDGNDHVLHLGPRWRELAARADRIRAERQRLVNSMLAAQPELYPRAKSPPGLHRAIQRLGVPTVDQLEWTRRDRHLWQYEEGCRRRSWAHRRDAMRVWVARLRERYGAVVLKDTRHKTLKETAGADLPDAAKRNAQHAAPGELVALLKQAFECVVIVPAAETSRTCLRCGIVTPHGPETQVICEGCGDVEDRDRLSTAYMLRLAEQGAGQAPTARKTQARFAKRHKKDEAPENASATA